MRIAFIGWGSLIWNPGNLKIKGPWHSDGPLLPVEFARISKDGRLTLVLCKKTPVVQTLWAHAFYTNLNEAIKNLREREGTNSKRIGYVSLVSGNNRCRIVEGIEHTVADWVREWGLDAAIWTDLPSNFIEKTGMNFNYDNAINYLRSLRSNDLDKAKKYIVNAPGEVRTPLRELIEKELGWYQFS